MKRAAIDWTHVPPQHLAPGPDGKPCIHDRLLNWARWCVSRGVPACAPMWRFYQPTDANQGEGTRYGMRATAEPTDQRDAHRIAQGVAFLPEPHRLSLHWYYVRPVNPTKAVREIGTNYAGLARLVHDGRCMLVNRGV